MPNTRTDQTVYLGPFSNVENFHQNTQGGAAMGVLSLFHPGEAGIRAVISQLGPGNKEYQLCQIDSGAVAATPTGAIAQGQLMYWKNRQLFQVTNDVRFSDAGTAAATRNAVQSVAGVLVTPTTGGSPALAGDWVYLQTKGRCNVVLSAQASPGVFDFVVPNNSATVPQIFNSAVGTAPGDTLLGRYTSATVAASVAQVDLQIPEIP